MRLRTALPELSDAQILAWADSYYARRRRWPTYRSGPIDEAPGETWCGVDGALMRGGRGLLVVSTLASLLDEHRGPSRLPRGTQPGGGRNNT